MIARLLIFLFISLRASASVDFGLVGDTYEIGEPDLLEVLLQKAQKAKEEGVFEKKMSKKKERIDAYLKRPGSAGLPFATEDAERLFDPTYTLKYDIPDGKGGILYPKGYSFNPLDYMTWNRRMCLINGDSQAEVKWALKRCDDTLIDRIILVDGCYSCLQKEFPRQIYFDQGQMLINHFGILKTPSIVSQRGRSLVIQEYALER